MTTVPMTTTATVHARRIPAHSRAQALRVPAIAVPDRIVPMLGFAAAALVALYVVLVVTAIFFASWQTQLASNVDTEQQAIGHLEDQYYAAMARVDSTDPSSMGLVAPSKVEYVVAAHDTGLTFAGR